MAVIIVSNILCLLFLFSPNVRLCVCILDSSLEFIIAGKPDLWIEAGNRPVLILDTKYKTFNGSPSEADRNQMIVYCHTQKMSHSLLIYAHPSPVQYRSNFQGIWLEAATLSLDGDLAALRLRCGQFLAGITARCDRLLSAFPSN